MVKTIYRCGYITIAQGLNPGLWTKMGNKTVKTVSEVRVQKSFPCIGPQALEGMKSLLSMNQIIQFSPAAAVHAFDPVFLKN